jgi:glycosyltransferase involved in cell wall biosynthesis
MKPTPPDFSSLSIALVYDRVNTPYGGAEHVIAALHEAFPTAPLFTSVYDPQQAQWAQSFTVVASQVLSAIPWLQKQHRFLAPLMPLIFESHDLSTFDIVISVTSAEAKGILTLPHQLHVCYILTPPRYLYTHRQQYLDSLTHFPPLRWFASQLLSYLTWWDQAAQARPDYYLPISQLVAQRTAHYYPHAQILSPLYPPVRVTAKLPQPSHRFAQLHSLLMLPPQFKERAFALIVSRLVTYKQVDVAVEGCLLENTPLVIVGTGPEEHRLKDRYAHLPGVAFVGAQPDTVVLDLMKYSSVVLMPAEEDFGITALDAVAVGTPVILHQKSGAAEVLSFPEHGQTISETTPSALKKALVQLRQTHFDPLKLHKHVQQYSTDTFIRSFKQQVQTLWRRHYVTH